KFFKTSRNDGGIILKKHFLILTFIIVGLVLAFFIGFNQETIKPIADYDDEQEALSDQIIIRFSHVVAENTPKGKAARQFAKVINEKTNGKVKVYIFPNATLFNETN